MARPMLFTDAHGEVHDVVPGHRGGVRIDSGTGYARSLAPDADRAAARAHLDQVGARVRLAVGLLEVCGGTLAGRRVLNVGADDGAEALCLAALGSARVVGTNHGRHFVTDTARAARHARLSHACPAAVRDRVEIIEDDIGDSRLPAGAFDVVCSWATLEHLRDPGGALRGICERLVPGGWAVHEYNPFFALDGGHRLCTLDLPWGHARLGPDDFAAWLACMGHSDREAALSFYHEGLNRMTLADLTDHLQAAGFEVTALVPRARTEDLLRLDRATLRQVRRHYPRVTVNDLVCRMVRVVCHKPA